MGSKSTANNPLGLTGIDHLEFCCSDLNTPTSKLFEKFGFVRTKQNNSNDLALYEQGQIKFILNSKKETHAHQYLQKHNEGVSSMAFRVENCDHAINTAIQRGAQLIDDLQIVETEFGKIKTASIQGFGDVKNIFIERPHEIIDPCLEDCDAETKTPLTTRMARIDHLTNNVPRGELEHWVNFYDQIYGFKVTRYFDIKGQKTGLESKVVQSEDNSIIIPINEPAENDTKGQIQEFLDRHNGAGVQHIALTTPDIVSTISDLRSRDISFLNVPDTYYEDIPQRDFVVTEEIEKLRQNKILVDGDPEGYLLQIFTDTYVVPFIF